MKSCSVGVRFSCMTLFYRGNPLTKSVTQNAKGNIQAFGRKKKWNVQCLGTSFHFFPSNTLKSKTFCLFCKTGTKARDYKRLSRNSSRHASGYTCCDRVFQNFHDCFEKFNFESKGNCKVFFFFLRVILFNSSNNISQFVYQIENNEIIVIILKSFYTKQIFFYYVERRISVQRITARSFYIQGR